MRNRIEILGEIGIYRVGIAVAESFMDFADCIRSRMVKKLKLLEGRAVIRSRLLFASNLFNSLPKSTNTTPPSLDTLAFGGHWLMFSGV
jgi:hypothetical protein